MQQLQDCWFLEEQCKWPLPQLRKRKYKYIYEKFLAAGETSRSQISLKLFSRGLRALGCHLTVDQMKALHKACNGFSLSNWEKFCNWGFRGGGAHKEENELREGLLKDLSRVNLYALKVSELFHHDEVTRNALFQHALEAGFLRLPDKNDYHGDWKATRVAAGKKGANLNGELPFVRLKRNERVQAIAKFCACSSMRDVWTHFHTFLFLRNQNLSVRKACRKADPANSTLFGYHSFYCTQLSQTRLQCILVMRRLAFDLSSLLDDVGTLCIPDARRIMREVLLQVHVLHQNKAIHGDIKPANIMYDRESNAWKLIDFEMLAYCGRGGIQRSRCGTPGFMGPEVGEDRRRKYKYNYSFDIWSCGITFLTLFTKRDHGARNLAAVTTQKGLDKAVSRKINAKGELCELLTAKMLRLKPGERALAGEILGQPFFKDNETTRAECSTIPSTQNCLDSGRQKGRVGMAQPQLSLVREQPESRESLTGTSSEDTSSGSAKRVHHPEGANLDTHTGFSEEIEWQNNKACCCPLLTTLKKPFKKLRVRKPKLNLNLRLRFPIRRF